MTKVVAYIRRFYDKVIITAGLGEMQDTSNKRIQSYKKSYMKGQPEMLILEFKTPLCNGVVPKEQNELLQA